MEDFEVIYREYFRDVELYLLALCREEGLAAELCSQVFFTALQQYPKFRGECHIRTGLCAIGRNLYLSHLRKRRAGKTLAAIGSLALCYGICQGIVCGFTFASFFAEHELMWAMAMGGCLWGALMCIWGMRRKM